MAKLYDFYKKYIFNKFKQFLNGIVISPYAKANISPITEPAIAGHR